LVSCTTVSLVVSFFFLMLRLPPSSTLFPYTTLFRSLPDDLYEKGFLMLSGSTSLSQIGHRYEGDLSGISISQIPFWFKPYYKPRSEEHTSELQSRENLVCRLLLEKKNKQNNKHTYQ